VTDLDPAIKMMHEFEGLSLVPYLCPAALPTIGYGHLILPSEFDRYGVFKVGTKFRLRDPQAHRITLDQAEAIFAKDLHRFVVGIRQLSPRPLHPYQFGALVSFAYNLGLGAYRSSTLRKRVNSGDDADVPNQFRRWVFAGGRKLAGLVRRREAEAALYARA